MLSIDEEIFYENINRNHEIDLSLRYYSVTLFVKCRIPLLDTQTNRFEFPTLHSKTKY